MKVVNSMGEAFKVGERSYRRLLELIRDGKRAEADELLESCASLGNITNVTDMGQEEAAHALERLDKA